ncbi:ribose 5-phosphate isomerase A [Dyadobacter jejuensis]|uniref:Ribose-5-phosphate isomerase A n=1 Tax=Dyadobacter jejuensis TaxID=1082580 RepID=A0A316B783_9BACT|nr:ribose-5-phosphate isomerase RpiA [Dyadobacter jejuensis]PWJ58467.1 ribose 5-phosphate isomerase A [Dyadobacter jejuensis]
MSTQSQEKELAAKAAVQFITNHQIVGLGTGSTAYYAIMEIGRLVRNGMNIKAIPTSKHTQRLAMEQGIPLVEIAALSAIDLTIDGADEFTAEGLLIKGGGGALLHEKIIASLSKTNIIIADSSKRVDKLGQFRVPIEVIPMACGMVLNKLRALAGRGTLRQTNGTTFCTDEGNYILDVDFGLIDDPCALAQELDGLVGVVEHGLFLNTTTTILMGQGDSVLRFDRQKK